MKKKLKKKRKECIVPANQMQSFNGNQVCLIELPKEFYFYMSLTMSNIFLNSHSASSTEASTRRRTNPTATPMRTSPFIIAAILNISAAALQVEESAPPPLPLPFDGDFKELKTIANDWLVHFGRPKEVIFVSAFSPPKEFNPPI